jgi:rSAM/selenodomain-associated transferase 1/secondary thiamine-phosphate synthase enzyme
VDASPCLLLFAKYPAPGRVKTRLAKIIGPVHAAALARCFILDELETLVRIQLPILLFHDPAGSGPAFAKLTQNRCSCFPQVGGNLGERMANGFEKAFSLEYPAALLVGSDLPDLPLSHLHEATRALGEGRAVIGPAADGGYCLIGLRREQLHPRIFAGISWGSSRVLGQTLDRFAELGKEVHLLPTWYDIDTVEELEAFRRRPGAAGSLSLRCLRELNRSGDPRVPLFGNSTATAGAPMSELKISTSAREEFVDITSRVQSLVSEQGWRDGVLHLFCLHTTAGLTINEAADPSVARDLLTTLSRLVPRKGDYRHMEGNSDAHIKASLMGPGVQVLVRGGRLKLGTWQGIFFTEFDGPRQRTLALHWLGQ